MLQSYSKWFIAALRSRYSLFLAIALPIWVLASFYIAQVFMWVSLCLLSLFNVPIDSLNEATLNTSIAAIIYVTTFLIVTGVPLVIRKRSTSMNDLGLDRLPTWNDILMAPVGFVLYLILSIGLISLAQYLLPWFDINQAQDTGFDQLNFRYEYILAFMTLVVIAPFAEEILFRGYLYGKLKKNVPVWAAILITSLLFGAVHGEWNLAVDTFALSVIMCLMRESTGSIWTSILLHMVKNGIAFYWLFINPTLLTTLGG